MFLFNCESIKSMKELSETRVATKSIEVRTTVTTTAILLTLLLHCGVYSSDEILVMRKPCNDVFIRINMMSSLSLLIDEDSPKTKRQVWPRSLVWKEDVTGTGARSPRPWNLT